MLVNLFVNSVLLMLSYVVNISAMLHSRSLEIELKLYIFFEKQPPPPFPWNPDSALFIYEFYYFSTSYSGIMQHLSICDCHISLSITYTRFMNIVAYRSVSLFFNNLLCVCVCFCVCFTFSISVHLS